MGGRVILKGVDVRSLAGGTGQLRGWTCIFRRFGEMVPGISSDLMTWVELRYATLEASGFDEPYKVYIPTDGGGNRSDIQVGGDRGDALESQVMARTST